MSTTRRAGEDPLRRSHQLHYDSEDTLESGSGNSRLALADDTDAEDSHDARPENTDALREHDKLVAYVHALSGHVQTHTSVAIEHSYARARACSGAAESECRGLLLRGAERCPDCYPAPDPDDHVDVETPDVRPEMPTLLEESEHCEEDLDEDEEQPVEWEEKILALAPTFAHHRIATIALEVLHSLRLEHLSHGAASMRADATMSHARRLRRALASLWEEGGPPQQRPAPWLHSILTAYLPRVFRSLYDRLLGELQRSIPKLCEGLLAVRLPAPARGLKASDEAGVQPSVSRPLLVWLPSGRERLDARWEQRLKVLLPVHRVYAPPLERCGVEAWCAGVAGAARAALHSLDAPRAMLALGGVGAGAALALQLASVPVGGASDDDNARALVLLAPPVLTAEGPRDTPDDPLTETPHPLLLVVGQNGMQCNESCASSIVERRLASGRRSRLVVAGAADDMLRMATRARRHLRVPQQALDAAIAEECVRWICEVAGGEGPPPAKRTKPLSPTPLVSIAPVAAANASHNENQIGKERDTIDVVQIPAIQRAASVTLRAGSDTAPNQDSGASLNTVVRCVRGGVVARGRGGTPLALPLPRRRGRPAANKAAAAPATPSPTAAAVAAADLDILDLPIVFADDNGEAPTLCTTPSINIVSTSTIATAPSSAQTTPVTLQRESKYSKVIVAKRAAPPGSGIGTGTGSVRPIVVRSGSSVRLVKRTST